MATPVLSAAVIAVVGNSSTERLAGDALYAWVYVVVYVGFAVQSLGIATLFGAQVVRAWLGSSRGGRRVSARSWSAARRLVRWLVLDFCCWRAESNGSGSVPPCLRMRSEAPGWSRGCCAWQGRWGQWQWYATSACSQSCAWLGTGAMVCWSGFNLLVAAVDAAVAESTPLPLTVLTGLSGVVLVAGLAMALQAMSQEHRLTRLDVEKHPITRLD